MHTQNWLQRFAEDGAEGEGSAAAETAAPPAETVPAGAAGNEDARGPDAEQSRRMQVLHLAQQRARAQFEGILRQSEAVRQKYPDFDLRAEMARPDAARLLRAGIPLETVYEFNHRRELAAAAVTAGAERVAAGVAANQSRPAEAGSAGTGSAGVSVDPAHLTRAQREDIKRRVANGERIVLSAYAPK